MISGIYKKLFGDDVGKASKEDIYVAKRWCRLAIARKMDSSSNGGADEDLLSFSAMKYHEALSDLFTLISSREDGFSASDLKIPKALQPLLKDYCTLTSDRSLSRGGNSLHGVLTVTTYIPLVFWDDSYELDEDARKIAPVPAKDIDRFSAIMERIGVVFSGLSGTLAEAVNTWDTAIDIEAGTILDFSAVAAKGWPKKDYTHWSTKQAEGLHIDPSEDWLKAGLIPVTVKSSYESGISLAMDILHQAMEENLDYITGSSDFCHISPPQGRTPVFTDAFVGKWTCWANRVSSLSEEFGADVQFFIEWPGAEDEGIILRSEVSLPGTEDRYVDLYQITVEVPDKELLTRLLSRWISPDSCNINISLSSVRFATPS